MHPSQLSYFTGLYTPGSGSPNRKQPPQAFPAEANVLGPSTLGHRSGYPHSHVGTTYSNHGIGRGAGYALAQVAVGHSRPLQPLVGRGPGPAFEFSNANAPHFSGSYSPGGSGIRQQNREHVTAPGLGYPGSQHASGVYHPVGYVADPPAFTAGPPVLPGWRLGIHGTPSPLPPPPPPPPPPPGTRPVLQPYYVQLPGVPHSPRLAGDGVVLNERILERMTVTEAQYQAATGSRDSLGGNYSAGYAMGLFHSAQFTPTERPTETPFLQSSYDSGNEHHWSPWMPVALPFLARRRKRKALVIGINYASHQDPSFRLRCCIEDAYSMANFLCDHLGFERRDVRIMTDTTPGDRPTKANILEAMNALVHDAQPGDSFFFYFSGHGIQIKDTSGDETDGLDECICAIDYRGDEQLPNEHTAGVIVDDRMHELLVQPLPRECRLTAIFDSCHSGTVLDLPYLYSSQGAVKEITHPHRLRVLRQKSSYADVISIGASKDHQIASETNGKGALRSAFVECMSNNNVTYRHLIQSLRNYMKARGFPQRPLLSSSHEIDTDQLFIV